MPTAPFAFVTTSRPADQPSSSRGKPSRQKIDKDKPRWNPIPITYTELFPKLVEIGHIEPVHLAPLKPPFPRWYNVTPQIRDVTGQRQTYTYASEALTY